MYVLAPNMGLWVKKGTPIVADKYRTLYPLEMFHGTSSHSNVSGILQLIFDGKDILDKWFNLL